MCEGSVALTGRFCLRQSHRVHGAYMPGAGPSVSLRKACCSRRLVQGRLFWEHGLAQAERRKCPRSWKRLFLV